VTVLQTAGQVLERGSRALCDLAGWMLAAMVVLINVEVVARYLFGASTLIADEYSGYLFVWGTLLGFGYALQTGQFLRVEGLVARLGAAGQRAAGLLAAVVGLGVALVCVYATWALFAGSWRFGTRSIQPSGTPLWAVQALLPLAFAWLCVLYLHTIARLLGGVREPAAVSNRASETGSEVHPGGAPETGSAARRGESPAADSASRPGGSSSSDGASRPGGTGL
jgi:TRAP-type C4-dicarboxylate transport system permease small subunit